MPVTFQENTFSVPVLSWIPIDEIDDPAMQQLRNAASHPEARDHLAVMPDCHVGYGIPVGSIMLTENSVIPNAVGVDIGCGVSAFRTDVQFGEQGGRDFWLDWGDEVLGRVPVGFSTHRKRKNLGELDRSLEAVSLQSVMEKKAPLQIGTLGGGNHFLEAAVDEDDLVWLMAHSGSRHTGLRIANHYHSIAKDMLPKRDLKTVDDLASLPLDDESGQHYLQDMAWAATFASENRFRMLTAMGEALSVPVDRSTCIDVPHNLVWVEDNLALHRKGATPAKDGQLGIIPGSMGTSSFIVRGLGAEESFESCSHGAGRRMSRKRASKEIAEERFVESLASTYSRASMKYVDEAPDAYKDIESVIERQADLVEVVHRLRPIMTLKGDSKSRDD